MFLHRPRLAAASVISNGKLGIRRVYASAWQPYKACSADHSTRHPCREFVFFAAHSRANGRASLRNATSETTCSANIVDEMRTVPNLLTLGRLVAVPGIVGTWYVGAPSVTAGLFGIASATDFLDGYLARKLGQHTALGALLDPVADKLLVATTLSLLVEHAACAAVTVPAVVILCRELAISSLREWAQAQKSGDPSQVAVAWHGKVKAALQMVALQALLVGIAMGGNSPAREANSFAADAGTSRLNHRGDGSMLGTPECPAEQRSWPETKGDAAYACGIALLWAAAMASAASGAGYVRIVLSKRAH